MALVGGPLAFKAKKGPVPLNCLYTSDAASDACPLVGKRTIITTPAGDLTFATTTRTTTVGTITETCSQLFAPCNQLQVTTEQ